MAKIKITREVLVGDVHRMPGEIIDMPARLAEAHVRAGTGILVEGEGAGEVPPPPPPSPPFDEATANPRGERATAPRQGHGKHPQ